MQIEPVIQQTYLTATSIPDMESTGLPAVIHERQTAAVRDYVEPWAKAQSSAAHMVYRHWADLIRNLVYGPGSSKEAARLGDPERFRELVYLEGIAALRMPLWIEQARKLDPVKGYKTARKLAERDLQAARLAFAATPQVLQAALLEQLP